MYRLAPLIWTILLGAAIFACAAQPVVAQSINQIAFEGYVAETAPAASVNADLFDIYSTLSTLASGSPEALNAYDQLSGAIYATTGTVLLQNIAVRNNTLAALLRREIVFPPISSADADEGISLRPEGEKKKGGSESTISVEVALLNANRYWALGYGIGGGASDDGETPGYAQASGGTLFGFDLTRDDSLRKRGKPEKDEEPTSSGRDRNGLFGSYTESTVSSDGLAEQVSTMELMFGFHSHHDSGNGHYSQEVGSLGYAKYHTRRDLTAFGRRAWSDREAFLGSYYSENGRNFRCLCGNLQVFHGWQYAGVHQYRFTEKGAGAANLVGKFGTTHSFRSMLGTRWSGDVCKTPFGVLTLQGSAVWWSEWVNRSFTLFKGKLDGARGDFPSAIYQVKGNDPGRNWGVFGLGLTYDARNWRLFAGYEAYTNIRQTLHTGNAGLAYSW